MNMIKKARKSQRKEQFFAKPIFNVVRFHVIDSVLIIYSIKYINEEYLKYVATHTFDC